MEVDKYKRIIKHSNHDFESWINSGFLGHKTGRDYIAHICSELLNELKFKGIMLDPIKFMNQVKYRLKTDIPETFHGIIDGFPLVDKRQGNNRRFTDFLRFFDIDSTPYIQQISRCRVLTQKKKEKIGDTIKKK